MPLDDEIIWEELLKLKDELLFQDGPSKCVYGGILGGNKFMVDQVRLSVSSILNPEQSFGIFLHELSHAADSFILREGKEEIRKRRNELASCTTNFYKKPIRNKSSYIKEDFADLLSIRSQGNNSKILNCFVLKPNITGDRYRFLTMHNSFDDNHRSTFLRLLTEAQIKLKDSMPISCKSLMARYEDIYDFNSCSKF
jgi:hypothetical protein